MPLAFAPLAVLLNYGKCTCISYLRTFQRCAKTAPRERKLGLCPETPCCTETPSVTLPSCQEDAEDNTDDKGSPAQKLQLAHTSFRRLGWAPAASRLTTISR